MLRRRGSARAGQPAVDAADPSAAAGAAEVAEAESGGAAPPEADRSDGPWDAAEPEAAGAEVERLDLGGLRVPVQPGLQLQVQVDERSGVASSLLAVSGDAGVQLVAVATPRSAAAWPQTREQIAGDARRRGGHAQEAAGPFGVELRVAMPVQRPDGAQGVQPSRIIGIDGPRWLLRATFLGRAAVDDQAYARLADLVRGVVVVRGAGPMAPGDVIALRVPQRPEET